MANLDPLIRLQKFQLEEKQRVLSKLYEEVGTYESHKKAVLDSVESEKNALDDVEDGMQDIRMMQAFMNYFQKSKSEVEELNNRISSVEIKIGRAIEEMREAFGELKKIEITRDRRLQALADENKKREDALFSEIALEMYRRKGE